MTLEYDWSLHSQVIGFVYFLTEIIIWVMFNENCLKGSRDLEQTRNTRVNSMTLNCDLDLESV